LPWAPGTWGSALAVVVWWWGLASLQPLVQFAIIGLFVAVSLLALRPVMRRCGVQDAPWIVVDEVAGQWLALLAAPHAWWAAVIGFTLFRLLDIRKPWLIGRLDRNVGGALGIMVDDIAAGIVVLTVLQLAVFLMDGSLPITGG